MTTTSGTPNNQRMIGMEISLSIIPPGSATSTTLALRGNGAETNVALEAVNDEAHVPACGVALVMFSTGARVGGLTAQGRLLSIIQIRVHAFNDGPAWMKIPKTIRYTVTAEKGQIV
jgi:hypothetical protein